MNTIPLENVQQKADEFFSSLPCQAQMPYPSTNIPAKNKRIANLLLDAFAGGAGELTAITQYLYHVMTIKDKKISNHIFCIALVEMHHLDMVGEMITSLGGEPRYWRPNTYYWSGGDVSYGNNLCEKISLDILAEQQGIEGYENLLRLINLEEGLGIKQIEEVIKCIIEDEKLHLAIFTKIFDSCCERSRSNYHK